MNQTLAASYRLCQRLARRSASNFYYSFLLLPRRQREAMCALYAFLRETDDRGDSTAPVAQRRAALVAWRVELEQALDGVTSHPLLPALADVVQRYRVPPQYLHDVIDGVEMDLEGTQYHTFAELEQYCYRVASAVGLACIHIWGFRGPAALPPARDCGIAFQLTNILRDIKEDAQAGRIYLPSEDLARFGVPASNLQQGVCSDAFRQLMRFEIDRAEQFYGRALALEDWLSPEGRRVFAAMVATYHSLLAEIKRLDGDVFSARVRLSGWRKLQIATRSLLQPHGALPRVGAGSP